MSYSRQKLLFKARLTHMLKDITVTRTITSTLFLVEHSSFSRANLHDFGSCRFHHYSGAASIHIIWASEEAGTSSRHTLTGFLCCNEQDHTSPLNTQSTIEVLQLTNLLVIEDRVTLRFTATMPRTRHG